MVVFFGVGVGGCVDVVATPRLRDAKDACAGERAKLSVEDDFMQHLAALDAEAIMCG